ncbi:hypothetical protein [Bradyrhizobium sp. LTSP857]|uniref:hypothetical protein n=1 Tax=Bradyrhizobium sp. LTSP857 TaxID=1619231 RepID=UPI000AEDD7C1|nr:hypothetical protein [Bradyrhizobium sp. LTSP857]
MFSNVALSDVARWAGPILLAIMTWFIVELIAKPFLRFRDLRGEIQRTLYRRILATRVYQTLTGSYEEKIKISREQAIKFKEDLAEHAVSLLVFRETETLASSTLKVLGYGSLNALALGAGALAVTPLPNDGLLLGEGDANFQEIEKTLCANLRLKSATKPIEASEASVQKSA